MSKTTAPKTTTAPAASAEARPAAKTAKAKAPAATPDRRCGARGDQFQPIRRSFCSTQAANAQYE